MTIEEKCGSRQPISKAQCHSTQKRCQSIQHAVCMVACSHGNKTIGRYSVIVQRSPINTTSVAIPLLYITSIVLFTSRSYVSLFVLHILIVHAYVYIVPNHARYANVVLKKLFIVL